MIFRSPLRTLCIIVLSLLLKLMPVGVAGAATLSMESFLGFNEHFQPGNWTPLTLTLENRGRDVEGRLEVIVTSGSEYLQNIYQSTYSVDVELPYNAKRLYPFSIKLNSFTHDLQFRFKQGDELLLSSSIPLRSAAMEKPFIIVVDEKASPDFLSDFPPQLFSVNVRPKFLPEHSYAYQSIRMMILNVEILPKLRENQFQALLKWIEQGGYLMITGGVNLGAFSEPRARRLFPAQILGHREFIELRSLKDFCGQSFRSTAPFLLLHIQSQDAKVLLREREFPVLAFRELGKGRIVFSTFHYHVSAFRSWEGKGPFWEKLLALHKPTQEAGSPKLSVPQVQDTMLTNMPGALPNPGLLLVFLGIYLLLLRWFFRRIQIHRGRQWGNAIAVTVLLLCAVLGASMLFSANNKEMLPHNIFVHLHGSTASQLAEAKYITGLYTIQESHYRLLFDSRSYPIEHLPPVPTRGAPPQTYRVHQSNKGQEVHGHSEDWQSQFFQLSDTIEFPLNTRARLDEKGLELLIRNDGQEIIQDALLYFQQGLYPLGKVPAGGERSHYIPLADIREKSSFDPSEFEREKYRVQRPEKDSEQERQMTGDIREMLRKLFARQNVAAYVPAMRKKLLPAVLDSVHARYQSRSDVLCLVGWQPKSPIDMSVSWNGAEGKSLSLLTWEIGLDQ